MTRPGARRGELLIEMDGVFDVPAAKQVGSLPITLHPGIPEADAATR
jgi:hypothetical protein